jgi:hypothetical protein
MQTEVILDVSLYEKYGNDGKFIIWRGTSREQQFPHDEARAPSQVYIDSDVEPGTTYYYKFKFVKLARDSGFSELIQITTPELPTPTPTCALYKYDYSHVGLHNGSISRLHGRYKPVGNVDDHVTVENGDVQVVYIKSIKRWVVLSSKSYVYVEAWQGNRSLGYLNGIYYGDNDLNVETVFISTKNNEVIFKYSPYLYRRDLIQAWKAEWKGNTKMYLRHPYPLPPGNNGLWYQGSGYIGRRNWFKIHSTSHVNDLPTSYIDSLLESSAVLYYNDADTIRPPRHGWQQGDYWKGNSTTRGKAFSLECFQLTPTPTPTFTVTPTPTITPTLPGYLKNPPTPTPTSTLTPTPTPTDHALVLAECDFTTQTPTPTPTLTVTPGVTYTPTPTPTQNALVLDYCDPQPILTETYFPILSETGEMMIME